MAKYKIAYTGYQVVEVEAESAEEAEDKFWDEGLNDLYNAEIQETVRADKDFELHGDLN